MKNLNEPSGIELTIFRIASTNCAIAVQELKAAAS
jgi:hypothetical protein